jgi:uncharacterized protein (DUF924 family)
VNPADVLEFWFGAPGSDEHGLMRKCWFEKDPAFDEEIRRRFLTLLDEAAAGRLDGWADRPESLLALIVLLDQFPRNLFRNTPRAFATDARALALAQQAVAQGFDAQLMPVARAFIYLPFEHCEELDTQDRAVTLFAALAKHSEKFASYLDYAERHRDVIRRFGRFPHRNAILGRTSTPEEIEFLARPGSGF